jgi:hypothetical protein
LGQAKQNSILIWEPSGNRKRTGQLSPKR